MTLQMAPDRMRSRRAAAVSRVPLFRGDDPAQSVLDWDRVAPERYRARRAGRTIGFVDVVGSVFVVLRGDRYDRAEEIAQTLQFGRIGDLLGA